MCVAFLVCYTIVEIRMYKDWKKKNLKWEQDDYVSKDQIRKLMIEIQEEIDANPRYGNIGKKGCYQRLSDLL